MINDLKVSTGSAVFLFLIGALTGATLMFAVAFIHVEDCSQAQNSTSINK